MAEYMQRGASDKTVGQTPEPPKGGGADGRSLSRSVRPATALVTGWIDLFEVEKGFCFGEVSGIHVSDPVLAGSSRVFMHLSRCRVVTGTADEPVLTHEARTPTFSSNDLSPGSYRDGSGPIRRMSRNPSRFIAEVERSDRGLRAKRWGIVSKRNALADLIKSGSLGTYVGCTVRVEFDRHASHDLRGELASYELTMETLTIRVNTPADYRWDERIGRYTDVPAGTVERTFRFNQPRLGFAGNGRLTITPDWERQAKIVFASPLLG